MSNANFDSRCGTCVWFFPDKLKPKVGFCFFPIPEFLIEAYNRITDQGHKLGLWDCTSCDCWQEKPKC